MVPCPLPQAEQAVGRPEDDSQETQANEQVESLTVETEHDQDIDCKSLEQDIDKGPDKRANGMPESADNRNDQNINGGTDSDRTR